MVAPVVAVRTERVVPAAALKESSVLTSKLQVKSLEDSDLRGISVEILRAAKDAARRMTTH